MRRFALEAFAGASLFSVLLAETIGFPRGLTIVAWVVLGGVIARAFMLPQILTIRIWGSIKALDGPARTTAFVCAGVAFVALLSGLLGPVNNWDSMTYHLPRVRHWLANGSTELYPTHGLRQLCFPPGSSYLIAQLRLIFGTDRLDFLPQWLAFAGLMASVSLSAERLGGRAAGALGAALVAGLPLAALEATTAQNDNLCALWVSLVLLFSLEENPLRGLNLAKIWAALALCAVTKPTALLFGAPVLLVALSREKDKKRGALVCAGLCAAALLPALPHFWRNREAFGAALGIYERPLNARLGLASLFSNFTRSLVLQIPLPPVARGVLSLHQALGLDPNDPATSFTAFKHLRQNVLLNRLLSPDEDYASAPLHFFATCAAAVSFLRARKHASVLAAVGLGLLAYLFLIKWQEWGNRLLLPGLVLSLPMAAAWLACVLDEAWRRRVTLALGVCGAFVVFAHVHRPLRRLAVSPRAKTYFFSGYGREHAEGFRNLPGMLAQSGCTRVGLDIGDDDWEEPWWALSPGVRFKNLNVSNPSKDLPQEFPDEELCAAIKARGRAVVYFDANDLKGYERSPGRVKLPDL